MSSSGFQFDPNQPYQLDAIASVVDLFDGQLPNPPVIQEKLKGDLADRGQPLNPVFEADFSHEVGAIGNNLMLDRGTILANLQRIQDRNGLEVQSQLHDNAELGFDVEMETGTGKTYVYLRTIFELAKKYNFTKYVILVPSVAIREGVRTSIRLMRDHFSEIYPGQPFDDIVYSGDSAEEVQGFATSTNIQILIMTIASIRGPRNNRIMLQERDKLNGLRPLDYLKATHPVVIMDEPQNMETLLSQSSIGELHPICTLRYSATHRIRRNVVYRLDPVDAHDLGLVKQIVVADVHQVGADATPYIKLVEVRENPWVARLELACRNASGALERKVIRVKRNQDLSTPELTNNSVYEGWRVSEMSIQPPQVEFSKGPTLGPGESIGESSDAIYKEMIRETVREHLRQEALLRPKGIKVLSLFFVDRVAHFLGDGTNNESANGDFARWFDEVFGEERAKKPKYQELLPQPPIELRRAYFSQMRSGGTVSYQDSTGVTKLDEDAYELIMQDKERLLDEAEPVRFIFSHSALREGWDNPNVFQICALREMGAEVERRQTIGRGLRLPVTKTSDGYARVPDQNIATLTVIANESYQAFAKSLQNEYKAAGVEIGQVRRQEFAKIPVQAEDGGLTDEFLGYQKSVEIWNHLEEHGFIKEGKITAKFTPNLQGFSLELPTNLAPYEESIINLTSGANFEKYVKPISKRVERKLNKQIYRSAEFEAFWNSISQRTTYRVKVDSQALKDRVVQAIKDAPEVEPLRIVSTYSGFEVKRGGVAAKVVREGQKELKGSYDLPDIITELQEATSLTRSTLVDILLGCSRMKEFIGNPNDFIALVKRILQYELARLVVEGIQYEKIEGHVYELRELQKDGEEERERFIDQLYKVHNIEKTDFDYVVIDANSGPERQFAELLDRREDIKLFMKLPDKFKIPTPVGPYNPDWAIIKHEEGEDRIYMIRETKSTVDDSRLRPAEAAKIKSARKHFEAIGVGYERSAPGQWKI